MVREARRLFEPASLASTYIDLNARHPVVIAFGKYVVEKFLTMADVGRQAPARARVEVARGHDWGQALGLARDALREGLQDWRTCPHPPPRVSLHVDLAFCRACSSWRGSAGAWLRPLGCE